MRVTLAKLYVKVSMVMLLTVPAPLVAQSVCDVINRIVNSGLDRHPFAAVDALLLPNAIECKTIVDDSDYSTNSYRCRWGLVGSAIDRIERLEDKIFDLDMERLDAIVAAFDRGRHDEVERIEREIEQLELEIIGIRGGSKDEAAKTHKKFHSSLYNALYSCFTSGEINDADQYEYSRSSPLAGPLYEGIRRYYWEKPGACRIALDPYPIDDGINLAVECPK